MRFKIELELKNGQFPLDYRPVMISFFKHSLTVYENGRHFNTYYEIGKQKPFTFAVDIPNSKFTKKMILVPKRKIYITFSTNSLATGVVFFNALMMQNNNHYPLAYENTMKIKNILLEKEADITTDTIEVVFKSPLCIREHIKQSNKDIYFSYGKKGFKETLNKVLKSQVTKTKNLPISVLEDFSIEAIRCKKTVVRHHAQFVEVTIGMFRIKGNIELLNYLYKCGMGSRKSSGFGLIDIIG